MQQVDHPLHTINQTTGNAASAPNLGRTGDTDTPVTIASAEAAITPEVLDSSSSGDQPSMTTTTPGSTQATIQGLQEHAFTTDRFFRGIRDEFSVTTASLETLDDANDRTVYQCDCCHARATGPSNR